MINIFKNNKNPYLKHFSKKYFDDIRDSIYIYDEASEIIHRELNILVSKFVKKYTLIRLKADKGSLEYYKVDSADYDYNKNFKHIFQAKFRFSGSEILLDCLPMYTFLEWMSDKDWLYFEFGLKEEKSESFFNKLESELDKRTEQWDKINLVVDIINDKLYDIISNHLLRIRLEYLSTLNFLSLINIPINGDQIVKYKNDEDQNIEEGVAIDQTSKEEWNYIKKTIPLMPSEIYTDVLQLLHSTGTGMERKPSTYIDKDEESIRDLLLLLLETRYADITASGETFNRFGKTDILLKSASRAGNVFVAECKFWRGPKEYLKSISQLFDRYLTWRDSKVAIILFVKTKQFSKVLKSIMEYTQQHEYFKRFIYKREESSFSYEFCLPQDKDRIVFLEIMAFHFDQ